MGIFSKIKSFFTSGSKEKNMVEEKQEVTQEEPKEIKKENSKTLESMVAKKNSIEKNYVNADDMDVSEENIYLEDIWNHIDPVNNTQAHHLISVIGFDEWVDMDEIRNRIKAMFFIEYKNEKSLYPYIKTLVDVGLLEMTSVGGKRKWKKREIVIKLKPKIEQTLKTKNKIRN